MKTLLIQVRKDKIARDHEVQCFIRRSGLTAQDFRVVDSLVTLPAPEMLQGVEAVLLGGSGDFLVSEGEVPEQVEAIGRVAHEARSRGIPLLGICFGAQIMAKVFGGTLEKDVSRQELGTYEITKTPAAQFCPIFSGLPDVFPVQLGHKDHITELPKGAVKLAFSERSEVQAFTFPGEKTYAYTFHPELDREDIEWRLNFSAKDYDLSKEIIDSIMSRTYDAEFGPRSLQAFYQKTGREGAVYGALSDAPVSEAIPVLRNRAA